MKKILVLVITILLIVTNVNGYISVDFDESVSNTTKVRMKEIMKPFIHNNSVTINMDKVTFSNQEPSDMLGYISYRYKGKSKKVFKTEIIVYYTESASDEQILCVLYHEFGHNYHVRNSFDMSERSANLYMLRFNPNCGRYINTNL